eukprot:Hpha_TRINITY_DN16425_c0_g6::TRINITY_DN16425_c0_g6_i1::g.159473::m.159473
MVTPAIVGKVNERLTKPGAFSWEEMDEIFAMDLAPHNTTFGAVSADSFTGVAVKRLGPKASLEAQMEAAARHAFDYGGNLPAPLPDIDANGAFQGRCHNCGARGHRASDCRGVGEYTPISTGRKKGGDDGELPDGMEAEDVTKIPQDLLIEAPLGALTVVGGDLQKANEEEEKRLEHNRQTAERSRLTTIRRTLLRHIKAALKRRTVGKAADELMVGVGGPKGLFFGDVPPGYKPTTRTCSQIRTLLCDFISGETPAPLMISVSRKEGVLRKANTRYACFVWWGTEEVAREFHDQFAVCIGEAIEKAWETCRDRDKDEMDEEDIRSGRKRPPDEVEAELEEGKKKRRDDRMSEMTAMGRSALTGWKDGEQTQATADPVSFCDVEGDEITFEAWFGGGARYTVNDEARPPFAKVDFLGSDPPQFPNARLRIDCGKAFRSVMLPDKHAKLVEQLATFFSACQVEHNLAEGPFNRFEIQGQSYRDRAIAARAALLLEPPPPVDEGRWS